MNSNPSSGSPRERFLFLGSGLVVAVALVAAMAREQGWGTRYVELSLRSTSAEGLRAGQEVRISGLPVGQVRALQLRPDAQVDVRLRVQERYASLIGPKSGASLGQEGLVGDHFVVISPDPQPGRNASALNGRRLPYEQPLAINNLIHRLVVTQMELQRTLQNTNRLTAKDLPLTLREMRRGLAGVQTLTTTLDREVATTAPQLREGISGLNRLSGTLDRETRATAPQLRQTLQQLDRTGGSADQAAQEARQLLRQSQPLLVSSLREIESLTHSLNSLLKGLMALTGSEEKPAPKAKP
jgi:phospholipid/cholesterol/gamma-HCH transport system substrate-binding protein